MRLGLYDPPSGKRLVLNAPEASRREYIVAKIQILPSAENIYVHGWQGRLASGGKRRQEPAERVAVDQEDRRRCRSRTRRRTSTLYLEYDARPDLFPPPQQVTLKIGDQVVGQFAADAEVPKILTFPMTAAQLGTGRHGGSGLDVDQTFKPGGTDPRELGIRVFHVYVEPK